MGDGYIVCRRSCANDLGPCFWQKLLLFRVLLRTDPKGYYAQWASLVPQSVMSSVMCFSAGRRIGAVNKASKKTTILTRSFKYVLCVFIGADVFIGFHWF